MGSRLFFHRSAVKLPEQMLHRAFELLVAAFLDGVGTAADVIIQSPLPLSRGRGLGVRG